MAVAAIVGAGLMSTLGDAEVIGFASLKNDNDVSGSVETASVNGSTGTPSGRENSGSGELDWPDRAKIGIATIEGFALGLEELGEPCSCCWSKASTS